MGSTRSLPDLERGPSPAELWPSETLNGLGDDRSVQRGSGRKPNLPKPWVLAAIGLVVLLVVAYIGYRQMRLRYPYQNYGLTTFQQQQAGRVATNGALAGQLGLQFPQGQLTAGQMQQQLQQFGPQVGQGVQPQQGAAVQQLPQAAVGNGLGLNGQNGVGQGVLPGQNGLVQGQNGLIQGQNGLVPGQNGLVQGQNGLVQGQNGLVQGQNGLVQGQNGLVQGQNGVVQGVVPGQNGLVQGQNGLVPGQNPLVQGQNGAVTQVQVPVQNGAAAQTVDWRAVTSNVQRSVVQVLAPGGQTASGVVVGRNGEIATVAHVFGNATNPAVQVTMPSGQVLNAQLVGSDRLTDLALLRVQAQTTPQPIMIGDANAVRLGDPVLAVGSLPGSGSTVGSGIVSGLNRMLANVDVNGAVGRVDLVDALQTDVRVNRGVNGGALVDRNGQLVGLVVAPAAAVGDAAAGEAFAVPVNLVGMAAMQLAANGQVTRSWLGLSVRDAQVRVNGQTVQGVVVTAVQPGSPAAKANFVAGDAVVSLNGAAVGSAGAFAARVFGLTADGTAVTLGVVRDGQQFTVRVSLAARPAGQTMADAI